MLVRFISRNFPRIMNMSTINRTCAFPVCCTKQFSTMLRNRAAKSWPFQVAKKSGVSKSNVNLFYLKDDINQQCVLLYQNSYIKYILPLHLCTAAMMLFLGYTVSKAWKEKEYNIYDIRDFFTIDIERSDMLKSPYSFIICVLWWIPCYFMVRRSFLRLYYYPELNQFIGIRYSAFLKKERHLFKPEDVVPLINAHEEKFSMFFRGNLKIKNKRFCFSSFDFDKVKYYNMFLDSKSWK